MKTLITLLFFTVDSFATPLHQAVIDVNEAKVKALVKEGSDINAVDKRGKTPLHHAASIGRLSLVKFLIENGADPHLKDRAYKTPLVYAIEKNRVKGII